MFECLLKVPVEYLTNGALRSLIGQGVRGEAWWREGLGSREGLVGQEKAWWKEGLGRSSGFVGQEKA